MLALFQEATVGQGRWLGSQKTGTAMMLSCAAQRSKARGKSELEILGDLGGDARDGL